MRRNPYLAEIAATLECNLWVARKCRRVAPVPALASPFAKGAANWGELGQRIEKGVFPSFCMPRYC